ncbi:MAG: serine--tRNA ligase [Patescibacteria group bacterium]
MLDIKFIRENTEKVKENLARRGGNFDIDAIVAIDTERRRFATEVDRIRGEQNRASAEIKTAQGRGREEKITRSRRIKEALATAEHALSEADIRLNTLLRGLPNLVGETVPVGADEKDNKILRVVGDLPRFDFVPRNYMYLASTLDLIDTERAAKVSGTRFGYLKNETALLEFALIQLAMDELAPRGFHPIIPPVLIREEMMAGMGYIDSEKDRDERYFLERDKLFLVGTAEQSLGPMHADEILREQDLPLRYAGFSSCFRREAGSYGKDTQGILRVHQFDKVEMFSFVLPELSEEEHKLLLDTEETLMQKLALPYRILALCSGDLAAPSAGTYDIEAWLPGQNSGKGEYRETHSTSNTTSFQARRLNIRVRRKNGEIQFVHMLNGTAFAMGRMIIAILENYQQADGSVLIPDALQKYMGMKIIAR